MKKNGEDSLKDTKLRMEVLYKHIVGSDLPGRNCKSLSYNLFPIQELIGPYVM